VPAKRRRSPRPATQNGPLLSASPPTRHFPGSVNPDRYCRYSRLHRSELPESFFLQIHWSKYKDDDCTLCTSRTRAGLPCQLHTTRTTTRPPTSSTSSLSGLRFTVLGLRFVYFAVTWASANPREAYMEMGATVTLDFEL
jgi:hypothetical protein